MTAAEILTPAETQDLVLAVQGARWVADPPIGVVTADLLPSSTAGDRGACSNHRSIKRQDVEARALRAMRELFFEPGAFAAFCEGFTAEMALQRREHLAQRAGARRELAAVDQ